MGSESRYSVSTKIFLIAASYSLPIAVLVWLMISSINTSITFSQKELAGTAYQRPLFALLDGVQAHQLAEQGCASTPCDGAAAAAAEVEHALDSLDRVQKQYGPALQVTHKGLAQRGREAAYPDLIRAQWTAISRAPSRDRDRLSTAMISAVRTLITHSGDTSNLILDPDLDSYYLMDVTLLALPQMQDRLGRVTTVAFDAAAAGKRLTADQSASFAADLAMLTETDSARIHNSTRTVFSEDANFYGVSPTLEPRLRPSLDHWDTAVDNFTDILERFAAGQSIPPAQILQAGIEARQASASYWSASLSELDRLLQIRIANDESNGSWALFFATFATLGAAALSYFLLRSITGPLNQLVKLLEPVSSSVERIADASRDQTASPEEAEVICEELNVNAEKMRQAILELAAHVQGSAIESKPQKTGSRSV